MPKRSSFFANEGTVAHDVGEKCLKHRMNPTAMIGIRFEEYDITVDEEMAEAVDLYVKFCRDLIAVTAESDDDRWGAEVKFELPFLGMEEVGITDFVAVGDDFLDVVDYKHGAGIAVDAYKNLQLLAYGLGAARKHSSHEWQELRMTIVQPRAYHVDGPIRTWRISRAEIPKMLSGMGKLIAATEGEIVLTVGDHCRFCLAKLVCPAQHNLLKEVMMTDIFDDDPQPVNVEMFDGEQLADIYLNKIDLVSNWVSTFKAHVKDMCEAGNPPPGLKLVESRPRRQFKPGLNLVSLLEKHYELDTEQARTIAFEEPKFRSVAQIEKKIGRAQFGKLGTYVERRSAGTTVVPLSDKRDAIKPSGESQAEQVLSTATSFDDLL